MENRSTSELTEQPKTRDAPSDPKKTEGQVLKKENEQDGDILSNLTGTEQAKAVDVALELLKGLRTF